MTEFLWPLAAVLISTIFFLIFREPLSTLIKRTKSIGRDGLDASHDAPLKPVTRLEDRQSDTETELRAEIARLEKEHAAEIAALNAASVEAMEKKDKEIAIRKDAMAKHRSEMDALTKAHTEAMARKDTEIADLKKPKPAPRRLDGIQDPTRSAFDQL